MDKDFELPIALLRTCGAQHRPHSGRRLLDHLIGTADILCSWGEPPWIAKAGLMHSIYGTLGGSRPLLTYAGRTVVAGVIGDQAENIAYIWSLVGPGSLERSSQNMDGSIALVNGLIVSINGLKWRALVAVYAANLVEQANWVDRALLAKPAKTLRVICPYLNPIARYECDATLLRGGLDT